MRIRLIWLTAVLLTGFIGPNSSQAQENILENGGFEDENTTAWSTYGPVTSKVVERLEGASVPEPPIEGSYALHLVVPEAWANF